VGWTTLKKREKIDPKIPMIDHNQLGMREESALLGFGNGKTERGKGRLSLL